MEAGWVEDGRERVGYVSNFRRGRRQILRVPKALQELFASCRETFNDPHTVPSQEHTHTLCSILDDMKPEDVWLSRDIHFFKPGNSINENPRVKYTTMYKCDNFSICMFFIPEGGVIPLHNHPGMTVFSKVLLGQVHIKSYDWVYHDDNSNDDESSHNYFLQHQQSKLRLAELKCDRVLRGPCDTSVLYPTTGGNMHEFTAITPCAVLDVIGPPYSKLHGRDSSYYKDHPFHAFSNNDEEMINKGEDVNNGNYWWLEEIEVPENSKMDGIEYGGPPISEIYF